MVANYLKVAIRNLMRNKTFSAINILGLAIGMACCMLILLYVQDELSYDRHHKNADRIFRLAHEVRIEGKTRWIAITQYPLGPALVQDYPFVVDAIRFYRDEEKTLVGNQRVNSYEKGVLYTDANVFKVFEFPLSKGEPDKALLEPHSIVLTEAMARKFFGDLEPLDQTLTVGGKAYRVTGVLRHTDYRSHLQFDFLASPVKKKGWFDHDFYTYLLLQDRQTVAELKRQLPDFISRHIGAQVSQSGIELKSFLQPLTDIHLHSHLEHEISPNGDVRYVYFLLAIAFLVLLLACINFTNLSTARSVYRTKEVGIRGAVGAIRRQLIFQFLGESTLLASIAISIAVVLVEIVLPSFGAFVERDLVLDDLMRRDVVLSLIGMLLFTGVLAGSYPAVFLSATRPVAGLKGVIGVGTRKSSMQRTLVVVQFATSVILLIGTGIVYDQAGFVRNKRLGFREDHVLIVPYGGSDVMGRYENAVSLHSSVINVSASSTVPGRVISSHLFRPPGEEAARDPLLLNVFHVDHEFIRTFGIEVLEGRNFSDEFGSDRTGAFMLNQAAMRAFGWVSCAGKELELVVPDGTGLAGEDRGDVIGVVNDFHYKSLHHEIEPLVIMMGDWGWKDYLSIRISPEDVAGTVDFLRTQWREVVPNTPFEYSFLDTSFDRLYRTETRLGMLFGSFSVLAIVVAALGLFGLASISVQQRTKEIGIRKALGASVSSIVLLLSKEYVLLVGAANLVAWPIAYFAMTRWLENFAYRIDPAISTFVLGGLLALCIALLTVSYETLKAARANPVDALRYE